MTKLLRHAEKSGQDYTYEIGSNSDLVLENTITGNLIWTIEQFSKSSYGHITFPTKFNQVDSLLSLNHRGKTMLRMSVNPQPIIERVEFGTAVLSDRIKALNKVCDAGYPVGLLIAPVIFVENWKKLYSDLIDYLADSLSPKVRKQAQIEIIFMTYSYVQRAINEEAFPSAIPLYEKELMTGRGRGKYCYQLPFREEGEQFLRAQLSEKLNDMHILYVV